MALFPSGSLGLEKGLGEGWASQARQGSVGFSWKHGTLSIMVFKMSFALYKFMEKRPEMLKSLKANSVFNTKVLFMKKVETHKVLSG